MQHPTWEELTDYIDKKLDTERYALVEAHIAACDDCSEQIEWLYKNTNLLRADTFVPPPRRVRVAAESLFDLRFGKSVATPPTVLSGEGTAAAPVTGGNVIPFPLQPAPSDDGKIIRPVASYWRRIAWIGGAVAALLVIAFFATQPQQGPLVAAVQGQQGQVDIRSSNSGFNLPFTGSTLNEGSSIATGADGSAQLVFANGAVRVVMLEDSNLVYIGGAESEGAISRLALATDQAGDLDIDVQSGVTVDLQTGVGLFSTTGGRFRFHYLEPLIVGVQVLRGTVTIRSDHGVYELEEGTDEVLDYSQPLSTPTAEPTTPPTATQAPPTATSVPTTTALPTRLPPSATAAGTSSQGEDESEPEEISEGNNNSNGSSTGGTLVVSPTTISTATLLPSATLTPLPAPEVPEEEAPPEEEGSGSGGDHDEEPDPEHDDNSGSGSGGGDDHEEEHDHDSEHD